MIRRAKAAGTGLLFLAILFYPVPYMFQGLDWTDQGHLASLYQGVFRHTDLISYSFNSWLTVVIGGSWMRLTAFLGLLGLRLGYVVVTGATATIVFLTLRRLFQLPPASLLAAVLVAAIHAHADQLGAMNWLGYNDLTALFFVWAGYHLVRGLDESRAVHLFAAGAILALNLFVRLPNILGVILCAAIVFHGILLHQPIRIVTRNGTAFASGYLAAATITVATMASVGHLALYRQAIGNILQSTTASETYGVENLVSGPLKDNWVSIQIGLYLLTGAACLYLLGKLFGRTPKVAVVLLAVAAGTFVATHDLPYLNSFVRSKIHGSWLWSHAGASYLCLGTMAFFPLPGLREAPSRRTLALVALFIVILVPLGSSRSMLNAHYGMWLPIGVIGAYLFSWRGRDHSVLFLQVSSAIAIAQYGILLLWGHPYRDRQDRTQLRYAIDHPKLRAIFTHQGRARTIQELLAAAPAYVHPGDWVLAFEYIPMFHYVTETRPYLSNPNPMYYSADQFASELIRAQMKERPLPAIVAAKGPVDVDWPDDVVQGVEHNLKKFTAMRTLVDELRTKFKYRRVWENDFFVIWSPGSNVSISGLESDR